MNTSYSSLPETPLLNFPKWRLLILLMSTGWYLSPTTKTSSARLDSCFTRYWLSDAASIVTISRGGLTFIWFRSKKYCKFSMSTMEIILVKNLRTSAKVGSDHLQRLPHRYTSRFIDVNDSIQMLPELRCLCYYILCSWC